MFYNKVSRKHFSFFSLFFIFLFLSTSNLYAETYSEVQLIPAEHWIYDAMYMIYNDQAEVFLMDSAPLAVNEIRQSLTYIDYEKLSASAQKLYDRVNEYLDEKKLTFDMKPVKVGVNFNFHPSVVAKTNSEIDWSFATEYSGDQKGYGAGSGFYENFLTSPFLRIPLYIDFADIAVIDCQASISKNFWGMAEPSNFTNNIITKGSDFEFCWPVNANASTGYVFKEGLAKGLAVNFHVARQGLQYGHTESGSLIYNNTFATDFYSQLRLSGKLLKYEMTVAEVDQTKFLYMHQIDFTPWKWIKLGVLEGTLLNEPFELRYFNPLMIMHSFASWTDYCNEGELKYYGESHVCAYMGIKFDLVPCKNLRIYGLFSQTEIQPPTELGDAEANSIPDGVGFQLGAEVQHGDNYGGMYKYVLEGIYTNPYLYIKHDPAWSMYNGTTSLGKSAEGPVGSWIGTPFGPDSLGGQLSAEYKYLDKWNIAAKYLFMAHGEVGFGIFNSKKIKKDGQEYYDYYPASKYRLHKDEWSDEQVAENERHARSWALTGVVQYTNRIGLSGSYRFNEHFKLEGQAIYNLIFNNKNKEENFQQGLEIGLAGTYYLF